MDIAPSFEKYPNLLLFTSVRYKFNLEISLARNVKNWHFSTLEITNYIVIVLFSL